MSFGTIDSMYGGQPRFGKPLVMSSQVDEWRDEVRVELFSAADYGICGASESSGKCMPRDEVRIQMKLRALALFAASLPSMASAGEAVFTISLVAVSNDSKTVIIKTVESQGTSVCPLQSEFRISTTATDSVSKEVYATALLALTTGKQLTIGYSDSACLNNAPSIRVVFLGA